MNPADPILLRVKYPIMGAAQEFYSFSKRVLVGHIFLGFYQDRRYVPEVSEFRDVVMVSAVEKDLHNQMEKILERFVLITEPKWVGITGPNTPNCPQAYCFWVKLHNTPFGYHWFLIRNVIVKGNGMLKVLLTCIRKTYPSDRAFFSELNDWTELRAIIPSTSTNKNETPLINRSSAKNSSPKEEYTQDFNMSQTFSKFDQSCTEVLNAVKPMITWKNFVLFFKSLFAVIIALIWASLTNIHYLKKYPLRLIHEVIKLLKAFPLIIVQMIRFGFKTAGRIFNLIAGMFRKNNPPGYVKPGKYVPVEGLLAAKVTQGDIKNIDWKISKRTLEQELLSDEEE